jgi:hypothetical protein
MSCVMGYRNAIDRRRRLTDDFKSTFRVIMKFTDEEATYMSQPAETLGRNELLRAQFQKDDITIIDAFACVGGDSISFMHAFPRCKLHSVQRVATAEETLRYNRLCENVRNAQKQLMYQGVQFHPYGCPIQGAFSQIREVVFEKIDLLFLDPPWYDGNTELKLPMMTEFLGNYVFGPMSMAGLMPEIICMKLVFSAVALRNNRDFVGLMRVYQLHETVPVLRGGKAIYFFHIFKHRPPPEATLRIKGLYEAFSNRTLEFISKCDMFDSQRSVRFCI